MVLDNAENYGILISPEEGGTSTPFHRTGGRPRTFVQNLPSSSKGYCAGVAGTVGAQDQALFDIDGDP